MEKFKTLVISDMHGWSHPPLQDRSEETHLDSRDIGGIEKSGDIHSQLINGGINTAASHLLNYECETIIGFSVGGVIAWKAALKGMKCNKIIAISATRLRYETHKPSCEISLIYGENDPFRPKSEWFKNLDINFHLIPNVGHEIYKDISVADF